MLVMSMATYFVLLTLMPKSHFPRCSAGMFWRTAATSAVLSFVLNFSLNQF